MKRFCHFALLALLTASSVSARQQNAALLAEMQKLEQDVVETYRNYLWLYYEEKQSVSELLIFEELLGVYIKRLKESYETMSLLGSPETVDSRDVAARTHIYRALTFLEKAPIDITYFEKACYDYYQALSLYEATDQVPAMFKPLPEPIFLGNRTFTRLIDLLDQKGKDLFEFGQVQLTLRNFKVTSPFDQNALELLRFNEVDSSSYTYKIGEERIKQGFRAAFQSHREENVNLALPAGTYFIRSKKDTRGDYVNLATLYVRPNQFIRYVVEPIADWVIFYETTGQGATPAPQISTEAAASSMEPNAETGPVTIGGRSTDEVLRVVKSVMGGFSSEEIDALPIPRSKDEFARGFAQIVASRFEGEYLSSWNRWTAAWNIAKAATESFAADSPVRSETIKLAYDTIRGL